MTGLGDDEVCIDYRICLMGHNSLWGRTVSCATLANPHPHAYIKPRKPLRLSVQQQCQRRQQNHRHFSKPPVVIKKKRLIRRLGGVWCPFIHGKQAVSQLFLPPCCRTRPPSQLNMNPATRGWSQFSPAYWLILQRLCWKTALNAIGTVGSQAIVLHACALLWFMSSTCVSYWIWSD